MKTISIVFRKQSTGYHSIENVFSTILPEIDRFNIRIEKAPASGVSIKNLLSFFQKRNSADLFHITGDIHYVAFAFSREKVILTIHDCVFLNTYKGWKRWVLKKILLDWPVRYVRAITTISEKSKEEIIQHTNCPPEKISVIPNPVQKVFKYSDRSFDESYPRLLFLGRTRHKNLDRVISAIENVTCFLTIIGTPDQKQIKKLKDLKVSFSIINDLTNEEVAQQYADSDIIVFPSIYEGFGLPILEGYQSGKLVLTSNISPMKEISDGAALLVDPHDVTSIRKGILELIYNSNLRKELLEKSKTVISAYQPACIAKIYQKLYSEIVEEA